MMPSSPTCSVHLEMVRWIELPRVADDRGVLGAIEPGRELPFAIKRVFFMHSVTGERGGHAHATTRQFLVPVAGSFCVDVSDGSVTVTHRLDDPHRGLYVPPMHWLRLHGFSPDAVCLVLADTTFEDASYIRDWSAFTNAMMMTSLAT